MVPGDDFGPNAIHAALRSIPSWRLSTSFCAFRHVGCRFRPTRFRWGVVFDLRQSMFDRDARVAVELRGRLGNQLFQFATARAMTPPGHRVLVDSRLSDVTHLRGAIRPEQFRSLTPMESVAYGVPPTMPRVNEQVDGVFRRVRGALRLPQDGPFVRSEQVETVGYDHSIASITGPTLLRGYFQNEKYFAHRSAEVIAAFLEAPDSVREIMSPYQSRQLQTIAVSLRGAPDYEYLGWVLPFEWYIDGVMTALALVDRPNLVVMADVPLLADAVAEHLSALAPAASFGRLTAIEQLHLMASCDHAIIGNSSFAWWGAWLGDHRQNRRDERIVIAPQPWVTSGDDILPSRWTAVDVTRTRTRPHVAGSFDRRS
jgi:Glycosyl transferase family 11